MPEETVRLWIGCSDCHIDFICPETTHVFTECPCGSGKIPADGGLKPTHHKPPSGE